MFGLFGPAADQWEFFLGLRTFFSWGWETCCRRRKAIRVKAVLAKPLAGSALGGSGDDFVLVQWAAEVGDQWIPPLHVHHADDEAWYVLGGTLAFRLGDEAFEAGPGSAVLARKGMPHTYRNAGDVEAEYLLVMPPRIASLIEAIHEPDADVPLLFEAHASELCR